MTIGSVPVTVLLSVATSKLKIYKSHLSVDCETSVIDKPQSVAAAKVYLNKV